MARSSSDLPLPEAPRTQTHSPASMLRSMGPTWRVARRSSFSVGMPADYNSGVLSCSPRS